MISLPCPQPFRELAQLARVLSLEKTVSRCCGAFVGESFPTVEDGLLGMKESPAPPS